MKTARAGTIKPLAAVALAALTMSLAACGEDGSAGTPAGSAAPQVDTGAAAAAADVAGDALSLGQRAVTDYVDYGTTDTKPTKVGVSVVKVRKGRIADFKDFNLDKKQRASVPYYVDAKFENLGKRALTRNLMRPSIEDGDGQEYRPTTLIVLSGTFKPCPEYSDAKLRPGQSFTGCAPILLPKGTDFGRVRFQGDVTKDPVFWEAR